MFNYFGFVWSYIIYSPNWVVQNPLRPLITASPAQVSHFCVWERLYAIIYAYFLATIAIWIIWWVLYGQILQQASVSLSVFIIFSAKLYFIWMDSLLFLLFIAMFFSSSSQSICSILDSTHKRTLLKLNQRVMKDYNKVCLCSF